MTQEDVKRLAAIEAIKARIEGMKAENCQHPNDQPFSKSSFDVMADNLALLAVLSDESLLEYLKHVAL